MKITPEILNALRLAIQKAGTQELLSKKCGIRQNYFSKLLTGVQQSISLEKWQKLEEYLMPFLPEWQKRQEEWNKRISDLGELNKRKRDLLARLSAWIFQDPFGERFKLFCFKMEKEIKDYPPRIDWEDPSLNLPSAIFNHPLLSKEKNEEFYIEIQRMKNQILKLENEILKLQLKEKEKE